MPNTVELATVSGPVPAEIALQIGNVVVHAAPDNCGWAVTAASCGLAYATGFKTHDGAIQFAEYVAANPKLSAIRTAEDAETLRTTNPRLWGAARRRADVIMSKERRMLERLIAEKARRRSS